jgi:hypothetical protein
VPDSDADAIRITGEAHIHTVINMIANPTELPACVRSGSRAVTSRRGLWRGGRGASLPADESGLRRLRPRERCAIWLHHCVRAFGDAKVRDW